MDLEGKVEGSHGDYPNSGSSLVLMDHCYGYNHVERFRFRNMFMKILEELRMRRASDRENERRIQELVQDRYLLEKKADQESQRSVGLEERHASETRNVRMKLEDRMRELKAEASQQHVNRTIVEKENDTYKDQLRTMQLTNYSLEKKVRELEVKLQLQVHSLEKHLGQLTEFENKYSNVVQQGKQLAESQGDLEKQVKKAMELNRNLMYVNEHQKCVLAMKNADLSRLQSEVLDLKVSHSAQSDQQGAQLQLEIDNTCLQQKLDHIIKEKEYLLKDCESWKEKYQGSVANLQEAHSLIAVNLQNLERYRSEVRGYEERVEDLEAELNEATTSLTAVDRMIEEERKTFSTTEEQWHVQEERYLWDIEQLKTELSVLGTQHEKTDSAQQELINQITSINKELDMLKTIVSVEKASLSCQTNLCMLKVEDHNCQTVIEVHCQQIQTESCLQNTSSTQTIHAALRNCACQTENTNYNSLSDCPTIPSTQDQGLNGQILQDSLKVPGDHQNKNATHKSKSENTHIKCIRKEESDSGCSDGDSCANQTPFESRFKDITRVSSDTKVDKQFADKEVEVTLIKCEASGNISELNSLNSCKPVAENDKRASEIAQHLSHVHHAVSIVTDITSTSRKTNDNFKTVIEEKGPEESANTHHFPNESSTSNLNSYSHQNVDMAATYLTSLVCAGYSHVRSADGVHIEESLKEENFKQDTECLQRNVEEKEEEDEIIAPSQPSRSSDGSQVLPTGKKRGFKEGDKCISADESLVSKPKHFKSDFIDETRNENVLESSSEKNNLHLTSRLTQPEISKSGMQATNTVDTKNVTQYVSSHNSHEITLPGHDEKENTCGKESKMLKIAQSTSYNKISAGTPSALDEILSSFMTPTIYMQSCKETRPSLSTKTSSGPQSPEKGNSLSSIAGFSPSHRTTQYRLSTKRSLVTQTSSSNQSPCSVSSSKISAVTKSCTAKQPAYYTQDIFSVDVKTEKPTTSLSRFGFLGRKGSIFAEYFNLTSDKIESEVHTEAPHVLYSRFLSSVKPPTPSVETKETIRYTSASDTESDNFSVANSAIECSSPCSNLMPRKGILKDPLTSRMFSPKKVHFSSPLQTTVQHQALEQTNNSPDRVVPSTGNPSCPHSPD